MKFYLVNECKMCDRGLIENEANYLPSICTHCSGVGKTITTLHSTDFFDAILIKEIAELGLINIRLFKIKPKLLT